MKEHSIQHQHHISDSSLGGLLNRCGHYFAHRIGSRNRGQESVLTVISRHPGITQKELAEALGIQPASVSELLMKLERKGLVLREKDERDRRSIKVHLTGEVQPPPSAPEEADSDPFRAISAEEQEQLRVLLEKLLADWEQQYPGEHRHHKHHRHDHKKENHYGKQE